MCPPLPYHQPCSPSIAGSIPGQVSGIIERGMARQGYDLALTRYANEGWRATFYPCGREHSCTSTTGSAWEKTPWQAVQRAAWETLVKLGLPDQLSPSRRN